MFCYTSAVIQPKIKSSSPSLFFIDSFLCLMGGYKVYMEMLRYDL